MQHLEVVADRRLGEVEGVVEVADARLAVAVGGHQRQQPQPHRVGQRLEQRRDPLGRVGAQRLLGQRRAAGHRLDRRELEQRLRHASILTSIYVSRQPRRHRHSSMSEGVTSCPASSWPSTSTTSTTSIDFYTPALRHRARQGPPGYANFAVTEPPLKLVLIENPGHGGSLNHLGVEVEDVDTVDADPDPPRPGRAGLGRRARHHLLLRQAGQVLGHRHPQR